MALQEAPDSIDITDIQFKVHSKYQLFNINASTPNFNGIDLLATASTFGLVIVGKPSSAEIQVLRLKDVVDNKEAPSIPVRSINIPGEPYSLALSCDHTLLSVCYTANGLSFMDIYAVQSFLSNNVACVLSKIALSNSDGVKVKQILWNPVMANTVAVCLNDGTLGAYAIKPNSFEYNSLNKSEMARCACWSPKGKQIVVAFPNGKLAQYKPDLKLAKAIPCAVQLFPVQFSPVAVQWLSTYQFAVVFVEEKQDAIQSLFIVNAPKTAPPTYINYYDITYSQSGPRASQVFLIHILQWNLLLMGSSNSTEIGVLGTVESGETPLWKQYIFIDEGRAELPLTADKQDTFPIGLALETGSTHHLTIGENQIPVMPMLHILSTHGLLLSFNLLNFQPTRVDICSPPQNIADQSGLGLFRQIAVQAPSSVQQNTPPQQSLSAASQTQSLNDFQQSSNLTFSIPETGATSTPAKLPQMQAKPTFGLPNANIQPAKPAMTSLFGGGTTASGFGGSSFGLGGSKEAPKPFIAQTPAPAPAPAPATPQNNAANIAKVSTESSQPFLTVQSNYKPSPQPTKNTSSSVILNSENDALLRKLIKEEITAFDEEIRMALNRSKNVQIAICSKDELSKLIRSIDEMQEITTQATESTESIKADVQSLRLTLYEMLAMLAEAQSKVEEFKKVGKSTDESAAANQTHRRLVNKLQNLLAQNQSRFDVFSKQLDANWNAHLQNKRENDKARMRIPTLENVYQTLEKQHQILMKEKEKINKLKSKVGVRDSSPTKIKYSYSNTDNLKVNSLIDSVLSLTIGDQIKNERKALDGRKLESLRKATLDSRQVNFIKPSRPDRKGLNSEVIIEKKLAYAKAQKEKENLKKAEAEAERARQEKARQEESARQKELAKPKPLLSAPQPQYSTPSQPKPKEAVEKQMAMSKPSPAANPMNSLSKSMFGGDKPQMSFGIAAAEKPAPEPPSNAMSSVTKALSFDTVPATSSGFSFGTKSDAPTVFGSSPSAGFGFGASPKAPSFGLSTQAKPDVMNLSKPAATMAPVGAKPALLVTPTSANEKPMLLNPIAASGANMAAKPITPVAKSMAPSTTAPPQNVPAQKPALLSTPTVAPTTAATPSPFKFDLGNAFSAANDKSKSDKENSPVSTSVPITKTSSIGNFSFSLGASNASSPSVKPATPTTVQTSAVTPSAAAPTLVAALTSPSSASTPSSKSPSSIGFSFAKASAESSIFAGNTATTNVVTTTAGADVSSSTDPSNIFQGFNICKPNIADNSNSLFGSSSFGSLGGNATSPTSTASIFGGAAPNIAQSPSTATSTPTNMFGSKPITTSANSVPTTSTTTSIFGGAKTPETSLNQQQPPSVFGAKPADSTSLSFASFGLSSTPASSASPPTSTGNIFATAAAAAKPAQNIFGGNAANNATSTASIFGGTAPASPSNPSFGTTSVFGNANTTSTNLFGGSNVATSTNNATSTSAGSIFGGASSPASGGTMFGGSASFGSPQQPPTSSVFGASPFGGGSGGFSQTSNATTSPPAFGSSFSQATSNAPGFGATPAFGSPFGQAGQQAQPGFSSPQPQQQQQQGFGLTAIAANANPTFGSGGTFGTGATFGSPKGFGTFASMQNTSPTYNTTPQKNTLFESLGSSENTMTFGNLAQTQNTPPQPKPFSGGSSFSSWR